MEVTETKEVESTEAPNEAFIKFCEVAKQIGVSDATIDLIKKDLKMEDTESEEEPEEEGKPEAKVVEVSIEKKAVSPMEALISSVTKNKLC